MNVSLAQYTVADLCDALARGDVVVNRDYQRSPRVWPHAARSFLIETILLGYPIPKLYLSQITDVKTRRTRKEIVDGQQRTMAIQEYYANQYKLSRNAVPENAAGKSYNDLDEELQGRFLAYSLTADLFIGASSEDIREMFRRMNSYTVALNGEEKRHAEFQGEFKWFIYRLSKKYAQALENMGVFSEKALARMADAKLLSELGHAILYGITTTNARILRKLYADHDESFDQQDVLERRISAGLDALIDMPEIHGTALMKPYQAYALVLALAHAKASIPALKEVYTFKSKRAPQKDALHNLSKLAEVLDDPDNAPKKYASFVEASSEKTNVATQREVRFQWYCRALDDTLAG